jgi:CIC family chloride channel protein
MGTTFAGIIRTPLTSVIMIFELTRDYSIIVPLMISNLISFFISQRLQHAPIYEALALQEGVYLPAGESRAELAGFRVSQVMQVDVKPFPADLDVATARKRLVDLQRNAWPVSENGRICGVATSRAIEQSNAVPGTRLESVFPAGDSFPFVHADQPLSFALARMGSAGVDAMPVVSRANIHQLQGVVTLPDILQAYGVARDHSLQPMS